MLVFLNGKFVPEEQGIVSIFDRSFCLGDGLFEAIPVYNGKLFLWEKHFERLQAGASFLGIRIPFSSNVILDFAGQLLRKNQISKGMLRLQLSRGVGARGYSAKGADAPTLVMTSHPATQISSTVKIITSSIRVPVDDPLSKFKTCSKLSHVVARTEASDKGADEALLLNTNGNIAEATSSNLFWVEKQTVHTPPLNSGALPGVTREFVLNLCSELRIPAEEKNIAAKFLSQMDSIFLTSSGSGVRAVSDVDGQTLSQSSIVETLREAYLKHVESSH